MNTNRFVHRIVAAAALLILGSLSLAAQDDSSKLAKIQVGMRTAPVPLDLAGKDANVVGYGSYLVNVASSCNSCHSAGPEAEYTFGGTPYFGQKPVNVNPQTYLGGGDDFGAFPDPEGPFPHIVSRNLTPDKSGLPLGGASLEKFVQIMRTGADPDNIHPTCAGPPDGKCIPAPFDGSLLQIMPWPSYQNYTDDDLQAIYEYLRAVPCVEGGPGEPENRCTTTGAKVRAATSRKRRR